MDLKNARLWSSDFRRENQIKIIPSRAEFQFRFELLSAMCPKLDSNTGFPKSYNGALVSNPEKYKLPPTTFGKQRQLLTYCYTLELSFVSLFLLSFLIVWEYAFNGFTDGIFFDFRKRNLDRFFELNIAPDSPHFWVEVNV